MEYLKGVRISRLKISPKGKNGRYVARVIFREEGKEPVTKYATSTSKKECTEARERIIASFIEQYNLGESTLTLTEYFNEWIQFKDLENAPRTPNYYRQVFHNYIQESLGNTLIVKLKAEELRVFMRQTAIKRTPDIANRSRALLKNILNTAVYDGKLQVNPMNRVKGVKHRTKEKPVYTEAEINLLVANKDATRYMNFFYFILATGMRYEEVAPLTWADITFNPNPEKGSNYGQVQVKKALTLIDNKIIIGPPKSEASNRVVHFTKPIARILALQKDQLRYESKRKNHKGHKLNLIFPNLNGGYAMYHNIYSKLRKLNKELGITQVTIHGLRHTYASICISSGVDVVTLSKALGHSDPAFTLKYYAHFFELANPRSNDALDKFFDPEDG